MNRYEFLCVFAFLATLTVALFKTAGVTEKQFQDVAVRLVVGK